MASFIYSRSQYIVQGVLKLVNFLLAPPYLAFAENSKARDGAVVPWFLGELVVGSCTGIKLLGYLSPLNKRVSHLYMPYTYIPMCAFK